MTIPSLFQRKTLWFAITGASIFGIGALVVSLVIITGNVLGYLSPVLIPLAVAGIIAYLLDPIVQRFQKWGLSRTKATVAVLSSFFAFVTIFGIIVVPQVIDDLSDLGSKETRDNLITNVSKGLDNLEGNAFFAPVLQWLEDDPKPIEEKEPELKPTEGTNDSIPTETPATEDTTAESPETDDDGKKLAERWKNSRLEAWFIENSEQLGKNGISALIRGGSSLIGFIGTLIGLAMVPVFLFYFLKDSDAIQKNWHEYLPLRASKFKTEIVETFTEINGYLIAFFRGQVLVSLIDGLLTGIALKILGLDYAISIGLALGVLGIMPFVGIILTYIPAAIIAFATWGDWQHVAAVTAIFVIVQQLDGLLIQPKIIGDSVGLHPMTIIFSVLLWSLLLGGIIGALLAVPLTAAVKVLFRRYIWEEFRSKSDEEPPPPSDEPAIQTS